MTTGEYIGGYPSNKFTITRSYAYQLSFLSETADVERSGNTFTVFINRATNFGVVYVIQDWVIPWSSNRLSLDFVVYDCWWFLGGDGVHHPQIFTVNYWWRGSPIKPTLTIVQPGSAGHEKFFALPGAPADYWLPPVFS